MATTIKRHLTFGGKSIFPISLIVFFTILATGCQSIEREEIETVDELAGALKDEGVDFDSLEEIDPDIFTQAEVDRALLITGENLWVLVITTSDQQSFTGLKSAKRLGVLAKGLIPEELDIDKVKSSYGKKPFIIWVGEEPSDGYIEQALKQIFPDEFWR